MTWREINSIKTNIETDRKVQIGMRAISAYDTNNSTDETVLQKKGGGLYLLQNSNLF